MSPNLGTNIREVFIFNVRSVADMTNSTEVLHWSIEKVKNCKVFVANRVKNILVKEQTEWK